MRASAKSDRWAPAGRYLWELRRRKGWSNRELLRQLAATGLVAPGTEATLSKWYREGPPQTGCRLQAIAEVFGITPGSIEHRYLLGDLPWSVDAERVGGAPDLLNWCRQHCALTNGLSLHLVADRGLRPVPTDADNDDGRLQVPIGSRAQVEIMGKGPCHLLVLNYSYPDGTTHILTTTHHRLAGLQAIGEGRGIFLPEAGTRDRVFTIEGPEGANDLFVLVSPVAMDTLSWLGAIGGRALLLRELEQLALALMRQAETFSEMLYLGYRVS